jgi:hypothetical protein
MAPQLRTGGGKANSATRREPIAYARIRTAMMHDGCFEMSETTTSRGVILIKLPKMSIQGSRNDCGALFVIGRITQVRLVAFGEAMRRGGVIRWSIADRVTCIRREAASANAHRIAPNPADYWLPTDAGVWPFHSTDRGKWQRKEATGTGVSGRCRSRWGGIQVDLRKSSAQRPRIVWARTRSRNSLR